MSGGHNMTLLAEQFDRLSQQVRKLRPMRLMTVDTTTIFKTEIPCCFVLIHKWTIHFVMAFVTGGVFIDTGEIFSHAVKIIMAIDTGYSSVLDWM